MGIRATLGAGVLVACAASSAAAQAPPPAHDVTALAKETQNPVGGLITIPLQFNFNTGGDLEDRTLFNLNLQPVIPFKVTANWNVIARTIVPINSVPAGDGLRASGVGDIQQQVFLTPAKPGAIILGAGPMLSLPTSTIAGMETGTWGLGPAVVVVKSAGPWVAGALATQIWPMTDAGGEPETDVFTLQPFVNYNFGPGWALSTSPIISANWDATAGNEWTVPLGLGITRTTVFNRRPLTVGAQYYYNVVRPDGGAGQQLKLTLTLLYPK